LVSVARVYLMASFVRRKAKSGQMPSNHFGWCRGPEVTRVLGTDNTRCVCLS
jgi:hypothetical protein